MTRVIPFWPLSCVNRRTECVHGKTGRLAILHVKYSSLHRRHPGDTILIRIDYRCPVQQRRLDAPPKSIGTAIVVVGDGDAGCYPVDCSQSIIAVPCPVTKPNVECLAWLIHRVGSVNYCHCYGWPWRIRRFAIGPLKYALKRPVTQLATKTSTWGEGASVDSLAQELYRRTYSY